MLRKPSPTQLEARLLACQEEYGRIKARIRDVGFICEGSLLERWMTCRKPNCRCSADPPQLHGPYYQLTWKEKVQRPSAGTSRPSTLNSTSSGSATAASSMCSSSR